MKLLFDSGKKSSVSCRARLSDGHFVVGGGGRSGKATFPMYYRESQDDIWHGMDEEKKYVGYTSIELDFEKCEVGVYLARLVPKDFSKGGIANDKIYFVDDDTGAYYTMDVADLFEMIKGFSEGTCSVDEKGIITAQVMPFTRGGTTFLSIFTRDMKASIDAANELAEKKKKDKIKPKELVIGNVYSDDVSASGGWHNWVYIGKGLVSREEKKVENTYRYSPGFRKWAPSEDASVDGFLFIREATSYRGDVHYSYMIRKNIPTLYQDLGPSPKTTKELLDNLIASEKKYEEAREESVYDYTRLISINLQ